MKSLFTKILKPLASLKLTVTLLLLGMLLVYAGTSAQKEAGIWDVQHRFFHSFFARMDFKFLLPLSSWWWTKVPGSIPIPGGYTLIALLLLNLVAAHSLRFKFNRNRIGVILIHAGLILLLVGEIVTSVAARESQMVIDKGQTVNFTQDTREPELAVIDPSNPDHDVVTVIPAAVLARKGTIQDPKLPFAVRVDAFFANSDPYSPSDLEQARLKPEVVATAGIGTTITALPADRVNGTQREVDFPSAYVTPIADGKPLDTFMVSTLEMKDDHPQINGPQTVDVGGKAYTIQLRWKRIYKPYSITLLEFTHDIYTGTTMARNFASRIRLTDASRGTDREIRIWMNHPLRYAGETFYQASFRPGDNTTILQVVRNPGWLIPYISCSMVALGMIVHFTPRLITFLNRRLNAPLEAPKANGKRKAIAIPQGGMLWPAIVAFGCCIYLFGSARPIKQTSEYNITAFANVPVSYEGRIMPLDSVARNSLRIISGKETLFIEDASKQTWFHKMFSIPTGESFPAASWLLDVMTAPEKADKYAVFRIDHPGVLDQLGLDPSRTRYSAEEIIKSGQKLDLEYQSAATVRKNRPKEVDLYQKKILELGEHLMLYGRLQQLGGLHFAPPMQPGEDWRTIEDAYSSATAKKEPLNPAVSAIATFIQTREAGKAADFNLAAVDYLSWLRGRLPEVMDRTNFETVFNRLEPFYNSMVLYVLAFLLICASWLIWPATLQRTALWVLIVTLMFHSMGLVARIYIQGRPPVTNLYSSAIFIAWGAAVMCLVLELIFKNGIGTMLASVIGFLSLLIAHNLAATGSGDTMQMLEAVLDTNIWLATHVVVVTLGYASTFLAGFLAIVYVVRGVFTTSLRGDTGKTLAKMMYGIICFAMLFSFVGTILGGIWADQSWGRFWGWDPKENGAVLIVLWNAIILHARWAGLVRDRGMALLAIAGNIVTSWSWFGTNMLGIGLHSYGFMESAAYWLSVFITLQIGFIALGSIPLHFWRSSAVIPTPKTPNRSSKLAHLSHT